MSAQVHRFRHNLCFRCRRFSTSRAVRRYGTVHLCCFLILFFLCFLLDFFCSSGQSQIPMPKMTSRTHRIPVLIISARFRFLLRSSFLLMFFFSLIFPSSQNSFCFSGKYYSFTGLTEIQPGLCSFYFSSKYRFCRVGFRQVKRNVRKPVTLFLLCALAVCLIHENGGCNRCV